MASQADKHSQDVEDHRRSWAGHLQHIAEPRQQIGSQEPLGRKKAIATEGGHPGLSDLSCSWNLSCRSRMGLQSGLYLDDVMSGQVGRRAASFRRRLCLPLFCCEFFILTFILLIVLAGHQREHRGSVIPREGAVKELLPEDGAEGEETVRKKWFQGRAKLSLPNTQQQHGGKASGLVAFGSGRHLPPYSPFCLKALAKGMPRM